MLKLIQVRRDLGSVQLSFSYDKDGATIIKTLNASEIMQNLRTLKLLLGRNPTLAESKLVVITMFNEIRKSSEILEDINWEALINVDLEA